MIRMLAGLVLLLLTTEVLAVAFCSLRDPVQQIQTMYPGFTGYTSEVRELKPSVAKSFIDRSGLPVSIHAKEIGKHSPFSMFKKGYRRPAWFMSEANLVDGGSSK